MDCSSRRCRLLYAGFFGVAINEKSPPTPFLLFCQALAGLGPTRPALFTGAAGSMNGELMDQFFRSPSSLFDVPLLTPRRVRLAYAVAVGIDILQFALGPLGWMFADEVLDVIACIATWRLLGFHFLLLPTFAVELLPVTDLLPTWTGCVALVIARRKKRQRHVDHWSRPWRRRLLASGARLRVSSRNPFSLGGTSSQSANLSSAVSRRPRMRTENEMATTYENLKNAFAGESQANQKYLSFAKKAEQEGLPNVARLFRTTAAAEKIHAEGHLKSLEGIGTTAQNLQAAIEGETYEYTTMYPPMLTQAETERHRAKHMFKYALEAEAFHAKLYAMALEAVNAGKDLSEVEFYLCPICGYIEIGKPSCACQVCGAKPEKFVQI
jgi:rubrerythrin